MAAHEHRHSSPRSVTFGITTVSDSRTTETDTSGDLIYRLVTEKGHRVAGRRIARDDADEILAALKEFIEGPAEAVVFTGGTGITSRDVTYETLRPLIDKFLDGFGELFRFLSFREVGSAAIMSRAFAGTSGGKLVFCLPGSPDAVRLAMEELILPEIGHLVREVRR